MKLFLSSITLSPSLTPHFEALVGKSLSEISMAFIGNAADAYSLEKQAFLLSKSEEFVQLGMHVDRIDLRHYSNPDMLFTALSKHDVIWVGGGNTYYLRWIMRASGFESIVNRLLQEGKVYAGGSAGAVVAGPVLDEYNLVDPHELAPELITTGLNLHDGIVIPHWGNRKYAIHLERIKQYYTNLEYQVYCLEDGQSLLVDGESVQIIP